MENVGVLTDVAHKDGKYRFKIKNQSIKECLWERGSILELNTFLAEKKESEDCMVGVHLDWDGIIHSQPGTDVLNEMDVLSLSGNIPTFISCKSGKMNSHQVLHYMNWRQLPNDLVESMQERYLFQRGILGRHILNVHLRWESRLSR